MSDSILAAGRRPIRARIELGFERWARWVVNRPFSVIMVSLGLTAALMAQLPNLTIDVSDESFLHEGDPVRVAYRAYTRQFGGNSGVLLALEPAEIFDLTFLERLRELHEALERVPLVEDVTSLINARDTYGRQDELVVEDLLEDPPRGAADLARLRERVFANPLFRNTLISEDGRVTTIVVELDRYSSLNASGDVLAGFGEESDAIREEAEFLSAEEELRVAREIVALVERYDSPEFPIHVTGGAILELWLFAQMQHDILLSVGVSTATIALLLLMLFRRLSGVVLPLVVVLLALLCSAGTMALAGVSVTLPIQVLPTFLLAVGVCGAVHIIVLVYRAIDRGETPADAICEAMRHSALPVVMAGLTTAGGLVSFAASPLAPVSHFGIFGPIGVVFSMLFVLVLLPALVAVVPLRPRPPRAGASSAPLIDRTLSGFGNLATGHPRAIVAGALALLVLAVLGILHLRFSHYPLDWLPANSVVRIDTGFVNDALHSADELEILLETPGVENGFQDPDLLARLDALRTRVLALDINGIRAANTTSIADILKETHQALNENRPEFYAIPRNAELAAQELLLFENSGSDDLEDFVDPGFSMASFSLRIPWVDAIEAVPFIDRVEVLAEEMIGERAEVTLTGGTVIFTRTFAAVIQSMAQSYGLALLIVTPLMILLIGTVRGGLVSMAPNLMPIVLTLGLMGWLGYDLDFSTMMIGAIVLGVAVDDTIHFLHVFQRYYRESGDTRDAVQRTLATTGRAILVTSIVLCVGFAGFTLATMGNIVATGWLTCFAVAAAFFADVLLAPAMLVLLLPNGSAARSSRNLPSGGRRARRDGTANAQAKAEPMPPVSEAARNRGPASPRTGAFPPLPPHSSRRHQAP